MPEAEVRDKVRRAMREVEANPALLDDLMDMPRGQRKNKLRDLGLEDVRREDVQQMVKELLEDRRPGQPAAERPVEWVAAVATLVAGALAA